MARKTKQRKAQNTKYMDDLASRGLGRLAVVVPIEHMAKLRAHAVNLRLKHEIAQNEQIYEAQTDTN